MYKKITFILFMSALFSGCVSVPMESKEKSAAAKKFNPPSKGNAGLYIYRGTGVGSALTKIVWVNDECVGKTAPKTFFYKEVEGNKEHKVSTESEFSPNDLIVKTETGKNYFVKQYIKMGVFVGGADLELIGNEQGKQDVSELELATQGDCRRPE